MDFNLFSIFLSQLCLITVKGETLTIGLILNGPDSLLDQSNLKSPVDLALSRIEDLVRRKKYLNFTLNFILKETTNMCSASGLIIAGGQTAELHFHNNVHAFIGPPCTFDMIATADLAAYWNIPALTGASVSGTLENKARYQTLTRSAFRSKAIARFLRQMFLQFDWARCAILTHKEMNYHSSITTPDVIETFKVSAIEMERFVKEDGNTVEILSSIKSFARGGYLCMLIMTILYISPFDRCIYQKMKFFMWRPRPVPRGPHLWPSVPYVLKVDKLGD